MSRRLLVVCGAILLINALVIGMLARQAYRMVLAQPEDGAEVVEITVSEGDTLFALVEGLDETGLISPFWFKVYAKLSGEADSIRPGSFFITRGESYASILGHFRWGNGQEVTVTIPEGYTLAQIGERVRGALPDITEAAWNEAVGMDSPLEAMDFVAQSGKPENVDLEGYLFPDTYRFSTDANAEDVVRSMIATMQERVQTALLAGVVGEGESLASLHDALTLASIVEKEVRQPTTMANVADIFLKRLAIGMALQSDATINYVTGGDDPSVSFADLAIDSLYNTYKYPGLPPGPISNPGLNALAAVATPAENLYYYFLTTDDGRVFYAETHDEHVANKVKYLR